MDEAESSESEMGDEKLSDQPEESVNETTKTVAPGFSRCRDSVLQVPLCEWTTLRFGEGQCDITEACVERMRAGEKCEVRVWTGLGNNSVLSILLISFFGGTVLSLYNIMPIVPVFVLHMSRVF